MCRIVGCESEYNIIDGLCSVHRSKMTKICNKDCKYSYSGNCDGRILRIKNIYVCRFHHNKVLILARMRDKGKPLCYVVGNCHSATITEGLYSYCEKHAPPPFSQIEQ